MRAKIARQGVLAVAAVRVVPVAPFTFVNLALGASAIKLVDYVAGTLLGMLPGLIVMSALGHRIVAIISNPSIEEVSLLALAVVGLGGGVAGRAGAGIAAVEPGVLSATVRLMTWNIHGAVGRNPRFDLARVVELILRHAAGHRGAAGDRLRAAQSGGNPFDILQQALGSHGVGAKTITTADGEYGQALFSRWPLQSSEVQDISYPEREPRRAIRTEIADPGGPLRVIATHLGLSLGERQQPGRGAA